MRAILIGLCALGAGCSLGPELRVDGGADLVDPGATCARRVLEAEVTNARELGGWPTADGTIACRRLLRGGALGGLGESGCAEFAALGIATVVDLRELAVQDAAPPPACVTTVARHVPAPLPKLLPDSPAHYLALLDEHAAIRAIFEALGDAGAYPVYWHCEIGRDRASVVTALVLGALGVERARVLDEFALSAAAGVEVQPACLEALLDELDRRGGTAAYLAAIGVDAASLALLRAQAVP